MNGEPLILAVDSSSLTGSVALCRGPDLIAESFLHIRATHSERLLQQIDRLLDDSGCALQELDLLAAVTGPGSFTGLRIGIATVKALAQVLERPVVSVSSLQAVALNLPLLQVPVCAFLDARKQEVYSQLFIWRDGLPTASGKARVVPPARLLAELPRPVALVGDGVPLYAELIERLLGDDALVPASPAHRLHASRAAWLACRAWRNAATQSAAEMLPSYVRPSDAELSRSAPQGAVQAG